WFQPPAPAHARSSGPPKIDGQHRSVVTLQENKTRQFRCQVDSWSPDAPTLLTWYLNGEKQSQPRDEGSVRPAAKSRKQSRVLKQDPQRNSTLSLRARKWDRELVCVASNPQSGESYNATVTLNVQFQPEILRVDAHYSETSDPGLSLVLFALVRSNPPATITWIDQSGHPVANASDFLILDSQNYPWLSNHTLRVTPNSLAGNVSVNASNSIGASRVEVPVLGIVTGGVLGFVTLLILTLIVLCLLHKGKGKDFGETDWRSIHDQLTTIDSVYLPRENMSLPSNMQLNDVSTLCKGVYPRWQYWWSTRSGFDSLYPAESAPDVRVGGESPRDHVIIQKQPPAIFIFTPQLVCQSICKQLRACALRRRRVFSVPVFGETSELGPL
uniref:Ig-like domain-containing protein n=1 Tax=Denticeps clupeoides TaxID=299321 RepID=A0AAY4AU14_9TELE